MHHRHLAALVITIAMAYTPALLTHRGKCRSRSMVADFVDSITPMTEPSSIYEVLAAAVRRLIDATIRTETEPEVVASAAVQIDRVTSQLSAALMPGSFGIRSDTDNQSRASGNVVIGVRNPSAPPLVLHHETDGSVWTEFTLGAMYEGPAGYVHGGICAMILDHVLGATAHKPGRPAYTGTLTLRYHRGTRLQRPLRAEAWIESTQGVKTFAVGQVRDADGVTVSAEGVFIHPRDQAKRHEQAPSGPR